MLKERKVLLFGFDGGTWAVLHPAMEQGYMPFLKSLVENGSSGILESTIPAITPAAWGTFLTGRNPGANGVYEFSCFDRQTKTFSPVNSTCLQKTLWQILSDAGKRVVSLNVPMTYPPQPVNGYVVSCILTPSLASAFTYPPEFKEELLQRFPGYTILNLNNIPKKRITKSKTSVFIEGIVRLMKVHADAACYLIEKNSWDALMLHFQETDVVQHMLFKYLDPEHPEYDPAIQKTLFSMFYRLLDEQVRRVAVSFSTHNPGGITCIVSDHGFESHHRRFGLGDWLRSEGFLKSKQTLLKNYFTRQMIESIYHGTEKILPEKIKVELRKLRFSQQDLIDWDHTRAFSACACGEGCIYLLEQDEAGRKKTQNEIVQKIVTIVDPLNSRKIVKKVHLRDELYSGDKKQLMPDIVLEPIDGYSFTGPCQNRREPFTSIKSDNIMNVGKHHREGIFAASGEGIRKRQDVCMRLIDIVPTLLYYMGVPLPSSLEGRTAMELFETEFIEATPVRKFQETENKSHTPEQYKYSDQEDELIQRRLKDLGYIE
jgi:predicted AlkP superfamily phosphohydrolase/phosphomutase